MSAMRAPVIDGASSISSDAGKALQATPQFDGEAAILDAYSNAVISVNPEPDGELTSREFHPALTSPARLTTFEP